MKTQEGWVATKTFTRISPVEREYAGLDIMSWAGNLDGKALEQARNLAFLPVARGHIALMPDAHGGYGMPIGGVLFTERAVVPYAIGVDIGCGVVLVDLHITRDELIESGNFPLVLKTVKDNVPTGFQTHKVAYKADVALQLMEDDGKVFGNGVQMDWFTKALPQLGTLGGGNHFIEFQQDEDGNVFVMLHSGSRSLGKSICDWYHKKALERNEQYHSVLPDPELAFIPQGDLLFSMYMDAMNFALAYAETNRGLMLEQAINAVATWVPEFSAATVVADCHHNYAAWENHLGINGIVHRKGAVRARAGELVLIPGSMGTASYLAEGLGNPASFNTCQHGAGRVATRGQMRRSLTKEQVIEEMTAKGIGLVSPDMDHIMEEASSAYKDIEDVMQRSATLVKPVKRLTPLGVVKG